MASKSVYEDYSKVATSYDKYRVAFGIEIILGALARYGGTESCFLTQYPRGRVWHW